MKCKMGEAIILAVLLAVLQKSGFVLKLANIHLE